MKFFIFLILLGCGVQDDPASEVMRVGKAPYAQNARNFILGISQSRVYGFTAAGNFLHEAALKQAEVATEAIYAYEATGFITYDLLQKYKSGKKTGADLVELLAKVKDSLIEKGSPGNISMAMKETKKLAMMDDLVQKHGELEDKLFLKKLTTEEFVTEFKNLLSTQQSFFSTEELTQVIDYLDNGKKMNLHDEGSERMSNEHGR